MKLKHLLTTAIFTTAMVLIVVGILNRIPFTKGVVAMALYPTS